MSIPIPTLPKVVKSPQRLQKMDRPINNEDLDMALEGIETIPETKHEVKEPKTKKPQPAKKAQEVFKKGDNDDLFTFMEMAESSKFMTPELYLLLANKLK